MPTPVQVKRSEFKTFMNTTPLATATYKLLGDGVVSAKINYNPKTTEQTFIHQDTASISVDSYAPVLPIEAVAKNNDDVFEFIDAIRKNRSVLSAAETDIINVWLYETPSLGYYPAEKQPVAIQIDDFGGDGGKPVSINFTINFVGNPVLGTYNPTTNTFTPNP